MEDFILNKRSAWLLILPGIFGLVLFMIFPLAQIIWPTIFGKTQGELSYLALLSNHYNQIIFGRTLLIALTVMIVTVVLGFPLALWISRQKVAVRQILSVMILFPILTNAVVRNFTWIIILGKKGVINNLLLSMHLIDKPLTLLYTNFAIIIGSVYLFLPIAVTTLIGSMTELNQEIEEAAAVLGANSLTRFFKVILPQLVTPLFTAAILVFAGSMTAYTTPMLLGSNRNLVLSTLIYQQAMTLGNWNTASEVAVVLIIITLVVMGIMKKATRLLDRRVISG